MTRVIGHSQRTILRRNARKRLAAALKVDLLKVFRKAKRQLVADVRGLNKANQPGDLYSGWEQEFNDALDQAFLWGANTLGNLEQAYYASHGMDVTYDPQYVIANHQINRNIGGITEDTKDWVNDLITNWYQTDQSTTDLIDAFEQPFGEVRAERIAITETCALSSTITDEMMNAAGLDQWDWTTSGQDNVCDYCLGMAAGGPYTRRDPMPPGPGHPVSCYCDAAPRLSDDKPALRLPVGN